MDTTSFAIIIIITTIFSYILIRRYFKINPRYIIYASMGIFFGLIISISITWPLKYALGAYGAVIAPYIMGIILMIFIEYFIITGVGFFERIKSKKINTAQINSNLANNGVSLRVKYSEN